MSAALRFICLLFFMQIMGAIGAPAAKTDQATPLGITSVYGVDGLVLWIAADRGVTLDGKSFVASLVDGTGNFTLTPSGSQGPLFVPKGLGGKPVFRFNGDRSLYSPDNFAGELNRDMTFITVAKSTSPTNAEQFVVYLGQNRTRHVNRAFCYYREHECFDGQFVTIYGTPVVSNTFVMSAASINPALTEATFYRNGVKTMVSKVSEENDGAPFEDLSDGVTFGAATDPVCGWAGDIAEVLIFNRQLSSAEVKTVWTALSRKYDLSATVPSTATATSSSLKPIQ